MNKYCLLIALALVTLSLAHVSAKCSTSQPGLCPEQVHLAYHNDSMWVVTWTTLNDTKGGSFVKWGTKPNVYTSTTKGTKTTFVNDILDPLSWRLTWVHRATIYNLKPGNNFYNYVVGSDEDGWSNEFTLKTLPLPGDPVTYAVYGDLGFVNSVSVPRLTVAANKRAFDMTIHVGDLAYNMHDDQGRVGDNFMNLIQPIATRMPYQTCPGNHELDVIGTFHSYKNRFSMPEWQSNENMFFSFDVGPVHFVAYNTECYLDGIDIPFIEAAYWWLEADLKTAAANRHKTPWIIVYGHRPMYCTDVDERDCTSEAKIIREGIDFLGVRSFGIEELFYKYGVDMFLCGHEHNYERIWPIYKETVYNGSLEHPYTNPKAPVYVVTGAPGCDEDLQNQWKEPIPSWSAIRNGVDYTYSIMTVYNTTTLSWEQIRASDGAVIDKFNLIKTSHGPFSEM